MDFEKIMHEITSGLSGDGEKDVKYLMEQAEKYKNHEMGKEIVRAIGRLVFKCVPEDKRAEMNRVIQNDLTSWKSVLEEVRFKQHEKRYDEALVLMGDLIRKFEDSHMFTDDQVSEYHCFNEFFEEALYKFRTEPTRELRDATFPLDVFYTQYGSLLVDLKRPEDAENALVKALRWNPSDVKIMFERAETHKIRGDIDGLIRG